MQRPSWGEGICWGPGSKSCWRSSRRGSPWGAGDHSVSPRVWDDWGWEPRPTSRLLALCSWTPSLHRKRLHPHRAVLGWGLELHTCGPPWRGRAPCPVVEVRPPEDRRLLANSSLPAYYVILKSNWGGLQKSQTIPEHDVIYKEIGATRRQPCNVFNDWLKVGEDHKTHRYWHKSLFLKVQKSYERRAPNVALSSRQRNKINFGVHSVL